MPKDTHFGDLPLYPVFWDNIGHMARQTIDHFVFWDASHHRYMTTPEIALFLKTITNLYEKEII